jgi:queuine/archaeosine tRNA-ribosyltransferase
VKKIKSVKKSFLPVRTQNKIKIYVTESQTEIGLKIKISNNYWGSKNDCIAGKEGEANSHHSRPSLCST